MNEPRYRAAERRLWDEVGAAPVEHRLRLRRNGVEVRVQETGAGPAVLFVHGGPGTSGGIFASLAARLPDFRCLLLDRPGTGLSAPKPLDGPAAIRREAETLAADVLDALGIERAHLVGSSHGSYVALHSAAAHPDRFGRTVHLGCPGFAEGMKVTAFDRLVLLPGVRQLFGLVPSDARSVARTFRELGHGATLDAGTLSPAFFAWSVAIMRDTDTMRHELRTMATMGTFRSGFDPSLTLGPDLLARVASPTHLLWGEHDPYGDAAVARRLADALPNATLDLQPGAGHLCWLDDVDRAVEVVRHHLTGADRRAA
jgi:2-hydroxy-6-oxonona-2,4-dienedioate hydrolase